jgi:hypothetical protein
MISDSAIVILPAAECELRTSCPENRPGVTKPERENVISSFEVRHPLRKSQVPFFGLEFGMNTLGARWMYGLPRFAVGHMMGSGFTVTNGRSNSHDGLQR